MEKQTVKIEIKHGLFNIVNQPEDVMIIVKDYDCYNVDPEKLSEDENGKYLLEIYN